MFRRGDFKKLGMLGSGKKNTKIFKVEHIQTKKIYVLKEVEARSLEKLNEYKEEAVQLAKAQNHPNILQFYGYYFYETTHSTFKLGIVCEFLNDESNLEKIFRKREIRNLIWKEDELLKMIYSMVDGLAFLQSIGICHRDIKPANLFLLDSNEIKIIDFGESKEYLLDEENNPSTMATIRGTPQYLSPILWNAHVVIQTKQVEHNIYKSDVFSTGLVLYQLCSMKDVTGFNQKTMYIDGEKLVKEGLALLGKTYSARVTELLRKMLIFDEERRPNFIELAKMIFGEAYQPKVEKNNYEFYINGGKINDLSNNLNNLNLNNNNNNNNNFSQQANNNNHNNNNLANNQNNKKRERSAEEKAELFQQYNEKQNLKFNMNKITYWFEFGGNMIAKFYIDKDESKWKLIGKYKSEFPSHFQVLFVDDDFGHFLIGGTDSNNTFQYRDGQITKKASLTIDRSFMSLLLFNNSILAIGGYEYNEKNQIGSIEVYDIEQDKWQTNVFEDLKVARSQANALVFNAKTAFVFGGYNKSLGTLNSVERINFNSKSTELLEVKLPFPLRRFASVKISESKVLIMGGITRLCKETDNVHCWDLEANLITKMPNLSRVGIIEHEVILDEAGLIHVFFENNYGTSPPVRAVYNFLEI
jgi:serine/threonine protein kinase